MTSLVFLATLGQRPEAITVAFDLLCDQYAYASCGILHTDPIGSGIADSLQALKAVIKADYPALNVRFHELRGINDGSLLDLNNALSAQAYHRAVVEVLLGYQQQGFRLHLLVSGGRKAMSIYAMLAASRLFDPPHDKVWTVLSPDSMIARPGKFHIPPGMRRDVQLVDLPIITARPVPGTVSADFDRPIESRCEQFLGKLTPEELTVALTLKSNPLASNLDLAHMLGKSDKTVENQLAKIYDKMVGFLDNGQTVNPRKRRQVLLALLQT